VVAEFSPNGLVFFDLVNALRELADPQKGILLVARVHRVVGHFERLEHIVTGEERHGERQNQHEHEEEHVGLRVHPLEFFYGVLERTHGIPWA